MTRNTPDTQSRLKALVGQICIYKEKSFVRVVLVTEIVLDDWGARFAFQVHAAPGFDQDGHTTFEASGRWDVVSISDRCVTVAWAGWTLVVRPDLVDRVQAFAGNSQSVYELVDRVNSVAFGND